MFKRWVQLENLKEKIAEAVRNGQADFPDLLLLFISTALGVSPRWFEKSDWLKTVELFYACLAKSPNIKIPITSPTDEKIMEDPWSYPERTWPLYAHLLAQAYGWSLKQISQLQVSQALSMIQEIITDKQLDREFQYGLSEIAYPYNSSTKKSIFKPLERPRWMNPIRDIKKDIPRFKIPKSMMPEGLVMMDKALPDEYLPKEIQ